MLQTDKGTKFLNVTFQRMLVQYGKQRQQVGIVERLNLTLKTKMSRYFTHNNSSLRRRVAETSPLVQCDVLPIDRHVAK